MSDDGACVPFKPECEEMEGKGARAEAEKQTFSKVWNGEDVTTLVQQLADNMSQQLGNTEN